MKNIPPASFATISSDNKNVLLGPILRTPVQNQFREVSITANAPPVENKIDKLIYNPGK